MSVISFSSLDSNVKAHVKTDTGFRVYTHEGRYFDLDENAYQYIDFLLGKLSGHTDTSVLTDKEIKVLDNLIKNNLMVIDGDSSHQSIRKPRRIILFKEPSIKIVSTLLSFLVMSRIAIFSLFTLALSVVFYQLKFGSELDVVSSLSGLSPMGVLVVFLLFYVASIVHEFGHAVACMHLTGRCEEIGLKFNYIFPAFYCDVSPLLMEKSIANKMLIGFSGVYFQILFTACLLPFSHVPEIFLFQIISLILVLMNLYPFARTDGYWILCDYLGYKNFFEGVMLAFKNKSMGLKDFVFVGIYTVTLGVLTLLIVNGYRFAYETIFNQQHTWMNLYRTSLFALQLIFLGLLIKELLTSIKSIKQSKISLNHL